MSLLSSLPHTSFFLAEGNPITLRTRRHSTRRAVIPFSYGRTPRSWRTACPGRTASKYARSFNRKGGGWYGWRRDYNKDSAGDTFAGDGKNPIDGLQFRLVGVSGKNVRYRVHCIGKGWLDWVTNYGTGANGYAGWYGYSIDAVQIEVV